MNKYSDTWNDYELGPACYTPTHFPNIDNMQGRHVGKYLLKLTY